MPQIVVARYREDLHWLRNISSDFEVLVYNKSSSCSPTRAVHLTNVGREAHTYLHHICENYGHLSDFTVFCQGKPFAHAFDFHRTLQDLIKAPNDGPAFLWLGHIVDTDTSDGQLFQTWSKNASGKGLDLRGFYRALWGGEGPDEYSFYLGGQFLVRRELILKQPRSFYERARLLAIAFPEAPHCFERCWDRVFQVSGAATQILGGRKTAYLKPVKRIDGLPR